MVLRPPLLISPARVEKKDLPLTSGRLSLVNDDDHAGGGRVVEQVLRQEDHAVDQIAVDEPLTDGALTVLVLATGAARYRPGIEHNRPASSFSHGGERMLEPCPVAFA